MVIRMQNLLALVFTECLNPFYSYLGSIYMASYFEYSQGSSINFCWVKIHKSKDEGS